MVQYLAHVKNNQIQQLILSRRIDCLISACISKNPTTMTQFIVDTYFKPSHIEPNNAKINEILNTDFVRKTILGVSGGVRYYNDYYIGSETTAFVFVCKTGNLPALRCMTEKFKLKKKNAWFAIKALTVACRDGHQPVAQYLIETYEITTQGVRGDDNMAVYTAVRYGHLPLLRYLVEALRLTLGDIYSSRNHLNPFRNACAYGHLPMVRYLVETYGLSRNNDPWVYRDAHVEAIAHGHPPVARYLEATFGLASIELTPNDPNHYYRCSIN